MEKTKEVNNRLMFIILCLGFVFPSIVYVISGRKISNLISSFTFFYTYPTHNITIEKIISTVLFVGFFAAISIFYYILLKNHKKEFKNIKNVAKFIFIISLIFFIMLPLTSTDVFYYIATGWSEAHYDVNPYYTSVKDIFEQNEDSLNDEILQKMPVVWRRTNDCIWSNLAFDM